MVFRWILTRSRVQLVTMKNTAATMSGVTSIRPSRPKTATRTVAIRREIRSPGGSSFASTCAKVLEASSSRGFASGFWHGWQSLWGRVAPGRHRKGCIVFVSLQLRERRPERAVSTRGLHRDAGRVGHLVVLLLTSLVF